MSIEEKVRGANNDEKEILVSLTSDIVSAYVSNNACRITELPDLIQDVYNALASSGEDEKIALVEEEEVNVTVASSKPKPAVNPKKSVTDDYLICLEDGRHFKSLKRHLMTHYNMTPEQYREKWGLAPDYPMVAPNYAKERSRLAKATGFGQKKTTERSSK